VRKILSILMTLGVVLGLMLTAAPAAAKIVNVVVDVDPNCACQIGVYNISFVTEASLTEGFNSVCVKFPAGTTIQETGSPIPWEDGDILIGDADHPAGEEVFGSEITVDGTTVCFLVPTHFDPGALWVQFTYDACIINPCTPGYYRLEVWTDREPDSIPMENIDPYLIIPCYASFSWGWDSSFTYPGIAADFVPPFKACGQANNATLGIIGAVDHPYILGAYMNAFNLTFGAGLGCESPCDSVDLSVTLTASPQVPCGSTPSKVVLNLTGGSGGGYDLATVNMTWVPCLDADGIPDPVVIATGVSVSILTDLWWTGLIHFDTPGDYTLCFAAECVGGGGLCEAPDCSPDAEVLAEECYDFKVHQWKDAAKVTLDEKWNLISLPLVPFDTDLEAMLASVDLLDYATYYDSHLTVLRSNLMSIHNYDAASGDWSVFATDGSQTSLTTLEDGKAYWFRLRYPLDSAMQAMLYGAYGIGPPGLCGNYTWWVFGTELPEPPAGPAVYPVQAGWNMVGVTSMSNVPAADYLWNWTDGLSPDPVIYGWDHGCFAVQKWSNIDFTLGTLESGQGYWMAFPSAGSVFQVVP